jgi:O-antigen/teichoic acid export membrane protein
MSYLHNLARLKTQYFSRGSFCANVLTLMTGTTIAQAIPIAISPIVTRLYTPAEYGALALFSAAAAFLGIIAAGRYERAIMLPAQDEDAVNIVALCIIITSSLSIATLLLMCLFNKKIALLLGNIEISSLLLLVPFSVFLTGLYSTLYHWSNRKNNYMQMSVANSSQAVVGSATNVGFGFAGMGTAGLIFASLLSQGVGVGLLGWWGWRNTPTSREMVNRRLIVANARRYQDFPKINSLHALVDVAQASGVTFLISSYFGAQTVGYFYLAVRLLRTPLTMLGSSISQVFFQKATETYNTGGDLQELAKKAMLTLAIISLPFFILIMWFAPEMFSFAFGPKWREAGIYSRLLAPWLFMNFIVSPISQIPLIIDQQKMCLALSVVGNALILLSIFYGCYVANDLKIGFAILSYTVLIYYLVIIVWILRISRVKLAC